MHITRRAVLTQLASIGLWLASLQRPITANAAESYRTAPTPQFEELLEENFSARVRGGARGDGKTDDTASLQTWIKYLVANHKRGTLGAGTYCISASLVIPAGYEWAIDGDVAGGTRILQTKDNVPIFDIGSDGATPLIHTWRISNIEFDYLNDQPSSFENATPIVFSQMLASFHWSACALHAAPTQSPSNQASRDPGAAFGTSSSSKAG
jgi:hypothetical protein